MKKPEWRTWSVNGKFVFTRQIRLIPDYCEVCEITVPPPTRHRIKPGREGGKYVSMNVIGVCPNCHWLADNDRISRFTLFTYVKDRINDRGNRDVNIQMRTWQIS